MTLKQIKERLEELERRGIKDNVNIVDYEDTEYVVSDIYYDSEDDTVYVRFE